MLQTYQQELQMMKTVSACWQHVHKQLSSSADCADKCNGLAGLGALTLQQLA